MRFSLIVGRTVPAALLASCLAIFAAIRRAQSIPAMIMEIHHNSDTDNRYPVLSTGGLLMVSWMQAAFHVPHSQLADYPYPTLNTLRLYLDPLESAPCRGLLFQRVQLPGLPVHRRGIFQLLPA